MHNYSLRVFYEHTDAGGVVYHANYLNFCEQARTEWLRSLGVSQQQLKADLQIGFVVNRAECKWLVPAKLDDLLIIKSQIEKITPIRIIFRQQIFSENNGEEILLFATTIEIACVEFQNQNQQNQTTKKIIPKKIPRDLVEKFQNTININILSNSK